MQNIASANFKKFKNKIKFQTLLNYNQFIALNIERMRFQELNFLFFFFFNHQGFLNILIQIRNKKLLNENHKVKKYQGKKKVYLTKKNEKIFLIQLNY